MGALAGADQLLATLSSFLLPLSSVLLVAIAVVGFAYPLPRRSGFAWRVAVVGAIIIIGVLIGVDAETTYFSTDEFSDLSIFASEALAYTLVLVGAIAAVLLCFDTSIWVASFCAAAGYTAQNFATSINDLIWLMSRAEQSTSAVMLYIASMWAIAALIFAITWWALIRRVHLGGLTVIESRPMMVMLLGVALFCIYFDLVNKVLIPGFGVRLFYIVLLRFTHGASCIFLLWVQYELLYRQRLQMDVAAIEHIRATEAKQYELSRENIEAINIKCHDIRHHIRQLEHGETSIDRAVLDDIVREVAIYDSTVRTGNDALDTILTEKSMLCKRQGITLSCIADGEILDFIPPVELYSLFGNALDNAMEAVNQVADAHRRSIGLVVRENMGMALIHVENVFDGEVSFEGGLPRTTKSDHFNHGFGVKSMKMTVEAHGGTLATSARDGVFHLNILIPIPMQN